MALGYHTGEWIDAPPQRKIAVKLRKELNKRQAQQTRLTQEITKLKEMVEWIEKSEQGN